MTKAELKKIQADTEAEIKKLTAEMAELTKQEKRYFKPILKTLNSTWLALQLEIIK